MADNIKELRFAEMDESGEWMVAEVNILQKMLKRYEVFSDRKLSEYVLGYLREKSGNKPLRAYFCRKIYDYLDYAMGQPGDAVYRAQKRQLFYVKLAFVFEIVIVIQYLHNHILDEKHEVRRHQYQKVNQNLIASNILRELLFLYLYQEVKPLLDSDAQIDTLHRHISKLLLVVDIGQRIDKDYNHYLRWVKPEGYPTLLPDRYLFKPFVQECLQTFMNQVIEEVPRETEKDQKAYAGRVAFIGGYFQRTYLTNINFFECITMTAIYLMEYRGMEEESLRRYSIQYGTMLQIINDYADFAYTPDQDEQDILKTTGKKTTDVFADLYNFNITIPLIFHLLAEPHARRKIEAYLAGGKKKRKLLDNYPLQIMAEITQSGAIRKCIDLSRKLSDAAKTCLDTRNPITPYFINMCDMAKNNKFYQVFFGRKHKGS